MIQQMIRNPVTTPSPPKSGFDEYYADTGIRLSFLFQGDSATDKVLGNTTLTSAGTADLDRDVQDTLEPQQFGLLHSHAYRSLNAFNDAWEDLAGDVVFGTGSALMHVSGFGLLPLSGSVDIAGNEDDDDGISIQLSSAGAVIANVRFGGTPVIRSLNGAAADDIWWEAVLIVDRVEGQSGTLHLGTIDASTSIFLPAGSLDSADVFSIFMGRATGWVGLVMGVRIALGDQLIGRGPDVRQIAQATGKRIWWDDEFTKVTAVAK